MSFSSSELSQRSHEWSQVASVTQWTFGKRWNPDFPSPQPKPHQPSLSSPDKLAETGTPKASVRFLRGHSITRCLALSGASSPCFLCLHLDQRGSQDLLPIILRSGMSIRRADRLLEAAPSLEYFQSSGKSSRRPPVRDFLCPLNIHFIKS